MLKDKIKGMVIGLLIGSTVAGGIVFAKNGSQMIEANYSDIKIKVKGEVIKTDSEPFIYEGSTYLPVRAVSEALGEPVEWDGVNRVVLIGMYSDYPWMEQCPPYEYNKRFRDEVCLEKDNKFFTMSGNKYTNGFHLNGTAGYALFNLNGKYNSLTFKVGHIDDTASKDTTMNIYLDGKIEYTQDLKADDVAKNVTIPLYGATQMKIELKGGSDGVRWGFAEGRFE